MSKKEDQGQYVVINGTLSIDEHLGWIEPSSTAEYVNLDYTPSWEWLENFRISVLMTKDGIQPDMGVCEGGKEMDETLKPLALTLVIKF